MSNEAVLYVNGSREDRIAKAVVTRSGIDYRVGGPMAEGATPLLVVGTSKLTGLEAIFRYVRTETGTDFPDLDVSSFYAEDSVNRSRMQRVRTTLANRPLFIVAYLAVIPVAVLAWLSVVPLWSIFACLAVAVLISLGDR